MYRNIVCFVTGTLTNLCLVSHKTDISRVERKTGVSQMVVFPQT